jgi:hypothetical protein
MGCYVERRMGGGSRWLWSALHVWGVQPFVQPLLGKNVVPQLAGRSSSSSNMRAQHPGWE